MPITLEQLDAEVRAALRRARIDSRRARVILYKPLDREHARNRRRYAQVIPQDMRFEFARATLDLDAAHRRALVAHEVGHVVEFRRKGRHTERDADRAAKREVGVPICYDRRWPGKGMQVDCRSRARNPAVPFPVGTKPKVPFHRFRDARPARVNVVDLIATQPAVSDHGLRKYSSGGGKRPMVARKDGRLYIMDGHHRATSALAHGEPTIDVRLLDLDTEDLMARSSKNPKRKNASKSDSAITVVDSWLLRSRDTPREDKQWRCWIVDKEGWNKPIQVCGTIEVRPRRVIDLDTEVVRHWGVEKQVEAAIWKWHEDQGRKSNPSPFTGDEAAEIQHRILLCADSVAENMGVDRVIETYHDTSKPSDTMEIKMKFVPRVPTQRHLTLVTNPKVHGFKPAQAELIREEFEHCAGRWADDNRLMISYKNPKPTPKAIPIRMTITRRSHKQADLFGNPERKVLAISKDRYKASADERRRYGGNTVTEFYMRFADEPISANIVVTGYGKTPGERKTDAVRRFRAKKAATSNPFYMQEGTLYTQRGLGERLYFWPVKKTKKNSWTGIMVRLEKERYAKATQTTIDPYAARLWQAIDPVLLPQPAIKAFAERGVEIPGTLLEAEAVRPPAPVRGQSSLFNPLGIEVGDNVVIDTSHPPKWWRRGDPTGFQVIKVKPKAAKPFLLDNGEWVLFSNILEARSVARPRRESGGQFQPGRNPTLMVGEFVAIDIDDEDLEQLASDTNPYQGDAVEIARYKKAKEKWERDGRRGPPPPPPRSRSRNPGLNQRQVRTLAAIRDATPATRHRLGAAGIKWARSAGFAYAPAGHPGEIRLTSEGHEALRAAESNRATNPAPARAREQNPRIQRMSRKITGI